MPDLEQVLIDYLEQLKALSVMQGTNSKLIEENGNLSDEINDLKASSEYQFIINMLKAREQYYLSVENVDTCLNGGSSCSSQVENMEGNYEEYESYLQVFTQEQNYEQTLAYYLSQMPRDDSRESVATEKTAVNAKVSKANNQNVEPEAKQDEQIVDSGEANAHVVTALDENYFIIDLTNPQIQNEYTITINERENIEKIDVVEKQNEDFKVKVTDSKIKIEVTNPSNSKILFKVTKSNEQEAAKLVLSGDILQFKSSPNKVTIEAADDGQMKLNITLEKAENEIYTVTSKNPKLDFTNLQIDSKMQEQITVTADEISVNMADYKQGEKVNFSLKTTQMPMLKAGVNEFEYTINDSEKMYAPFVVESIEIANTSISLIDEPFEQSEQSIVSSSDDGNDTIEQGEELGIKVDIELQADSQFAISNLLLNLSYPNQILNTPDLYAITFNDQIITNGVNISNASEGLMVDFTTPLNANGEEGKYQANISLYANVQAHTEISNFTENYYVGLNTINVVTDTGIETTADVSDLETSQADIKFELGAPEITSLTYEASEPSCSKNVTKVEDCTFEAGETVARTIVIENKSDSAAFGLNLIDKLGSDDLSYEVGSSFEYKLIDEDGVEVTDGSFILTPTLSDQGAEVSFTLPANSRVEITNTLQIASAIKAEQTIENSMTLNQLGIERGNTIGKLTVLPMQLEAQIISTNQIVEDEVITADEALKVQARLINNSKYAVIEKGGIIINNSASSSISNIEVDSIVDENWYEVTDVSMSTDKAAVTINEKLEPHDYVDVTFKIRFNKLTSGEKSNDVQVCAYYLTSSDITSCGDSQSFALSADSYEQLAKDKLANGEVVSGQTYDEALENTTALNTVYENIKETTNKMKKYIDKYTGYNETLNDITELSQKDIKQMIDNIDKNGLGIESEDDDNPLAQYEYCDGNEEVSCQIINIFNQVYSGEKNAKTHLLDTLTVIDPNNTEDTEYKVDTDGEPTNDPVNVGADFNGYGDCSPEDEACSSGDVGIWGRIDKQKADIEQLNGKVDELINNEIQPVDQAVFANEATTQVDNMNSNMSQTISDNEELLSDKAQVYDENYTIVQEYIQAINEDDSYQTAINSFRDDENMRVKEENEIIGEVAMLLPNTYLNGIPNKMVYSFIATPIKAYDLSKNSVQTEQGESEVGSSDAGQSSGNKKYIMIVAIGFILILVFVFIFLKSILKI